MNVNLLQHIGIDTSEAKAGDYVKDGLLYCGVCGEPKQYRLTIPFKAGETVNIVPIACSCDRARYKAEDERREANERKARVCELARYSLMEEAQKGYTFESADRNGINEGALKLAERYCDKFAECKKQGRGLIFYGSMGTGKSYTAMCIANRLLSQEHTVIVTSFVKLGNAAFGEDEEIISRMNSAELLVLDDLGVERRSDYSCERVYNVIDSRVRSGLPMVITTNLTITGMQNETDIRARRTYDRIFQKCYPVAFKGISQRMLEASVLHDEMSKLLGS